MAKSIRSKIKKRFRTAKRLRVVAMVEKPRTARKNAALQEVINGSAGSKNQGTSLHKAGTAGIGKRNAFLYPNDKNAEIPQQSVKKPIDFRASHNLTVRFINSLLFVFLFTKSEVVLCIAEVTLFYTHHVLLLLLILTKSKN